MNCKTCGKEFESRRNTAKYCSVTCRVNNNREVSVTDKIDTNVTVKKESWLCKHGGCYLRSPVGHDGLCIYHWRKSLLMPTISKEDYEELNEAQKEVV